MIRIEQVSKSYDHGKSFTVRELSLEVARGELLVLLGGSGCGKTTTLKTINRLIRPTTGRVLIEGSDITTLDPVKLPRQPRVDCDFRRPGLRKH